jgi:hypothetical protein
VQGEDAQMIRNGMQRPIPEDGLQDWDRGCLVGWGGLYKDVCGLLHI